MISRETPRKRAQYDITQEQQTLLREQVGHEMNDEILCCEVKVFQTDYLPQNRLLEEEYIILRDVGLEIAQSYFKKNQLFIEEADLSERLKQVVDALLRTRKEGGRQRNLWFNADRNKKFISAALGGTSETDSCLNNEAGSLRTTDIIVPMEFKLVGDFDKVGQNRLQLASSVIHILNDDVRRMFMFGITIEGHRMTLWYFSRSHSVKSQSFDFVKHPETLVSVLISLVFADDKDLGFDPNITLKSNTRQNPDWRVHECLSSFDQEEDADVMDAFGKLLEGERYKDLFLVIQDGSTGECSKPLAQSAWRSASKIFFSGVNPTRANDPFLTTQRLSVPRSSTTRNLQTHPADEDTQPAYRKCAPKQRSFLVFDDECTRLYCLPTVGDVFTVLNDCIAALRLMFCAGWVHRDISCSNVMAIRDPETQQWKLKLSDLEYSKKFGLTSDPKTGTPFFMPCEILRRRYFGLKRGVKAIPGVSRRKANLDKASQQAEPTYPLAHNFLHDLEASWWTTLWIITSRVDHKPSETYALPIFRNTSTLELSDPRLAALEEEIDKKLYACLLEPLKGVVGEFERIRLHLAQTAEDLGKAKAWSMEKGCQLYSELHANFGTAFAEFANPEAKWASVRLKIPTSSSPRPMDSIVDEDPNELPVAPYYEEELLPLRAKSEDSDEAAWVLADMPLPASLPPANGIKRLHHDVEQGNGDDEDGGRLSHSRRIKSNDGERISGSAGASTSAGARYTLRPNAKGCRNQSRK
ncbi:hypothetical protein EST38_g9837 [Candolleomyces aberdarensis]|uniref:Fungal-type protein kinase domain-containing protein n=1 Tax=Candolleomyces aberdarensis TaxID=2316362 RepID=A0A4Q2DBA9_9AGAR|nr:hypothetical protein EST38_g9837 [Candolleomyces aberdarensis]